MHETIQADWRGGGGAGREKRGRKACAHTHRSEGRKRISTQEALAMSCLNALNASGHCHIQVPFAGRWHAFKAEIQTQSWLACCRPQGHAGAASQSSRGDMLLPTGQSGGGSISRAGRRNGVEKMGGVARCL